MTPITKSRSENVGAKVIYALTRSSVNLAYLSALIAMLSASIGIQVKPASAAKDDTALYAASTYNPDTAVNWANSNNRNDGGFYESEGRWCTTYVTKAWRAGGIDIPVYDGNASLTSWLRSNPSVWEIRPLDQLEKGDIIFYDNRGNISDNLYPADLGHVVLVTGSNMASAWNAELMNRPFNLWLSKLPYSKGVHIKRSSSTDYNGDGTPDLYVIARESTGTHSTEVHILSGADGYQTWLLHTGTPLGETGHNGDVAFGVADYNQDGKPDLYVITREHTGTQSTEVHILSGADGYQTWLLHTGTPLGETGHNGNIILGLADYNQDGTPDLYVITRENTGTHSTEVHILSGADGYQTWLLHTGTPLGETGHNGNIIFGLADYNKDGTPDLYVITRENTGTHSTEVHILSGADGYQTWLLHTGTPLGETGHNGNIIFGLADYNKDGTPDLYVITRENTGTHSTEVHILSGVDGYQTWLLHTGTPLGETGSACNFDFAPGEDCITSINTIYLPLIIS